MFCPVCGETTEHLNGSLWGTSKHICGECEVEWVLTNIPDVPYTVQKKEED